MKPAVLLIGNFLSASVGIPGVSEGLAEQLTAAGWTVLTASAKPGRLARLSDMLWTVWRQRRGYELAHVEVYSGPAFRLAEMVCGLLRWLRKPYVLTLHGGNLPAFAARHPARVRNLFQSAAAVTTPSRYLLEQLQAYRDGLQLIPNPLHLPQYPFRLRSALAPHLLWLRSFHAIYNPTLAPRVLALLQDEFPDIHLTMIGPDKGDGSLQATQQTARALGVAARLDCPGPIAKTDVGAWLQRGDVFLNTTNIDNAPVSVLEALACGLCVVSTNVGGIPYLLTHQQDALLTPPDDAAALAQAVRQLLRDPALAASLSRNGRALAEARDWPRVLRQWEQLFLASRNRPASSSGSQCEQDAHGTI
jgi:glycosyltransferase involved in cell wall biosynthesis